MTLAPVTAEDVVVAKPNVAEDGVEEAAADEITVVAVVVCTRTMAVPLVVAAVAGVLDVVAIL